MGNRLEFIGKPVAKPRMTRSDAWKKRPAVERYWAFKDALKAAADSQSFVLGESYAVTFVIPMPDRMSMKQKAALNGKPHKVRPDLDNMLKSLNDCLMKEDSSVHFVKARKIWGVGGKIIVENLDK